MNFHHLELQGVLKLTSFFCSSLRIASLGSTCLIVHDVGASWFLLVTTLEFVEGGLMVALMGSWSRNLAWSLELGMVFGCLAWSLVARHGLENWFLLQVMYLTFL